MRSNENFFTKTGKNCDTVAKRDRKIWTKMQMVFSFTCKYIEEERNTCSWTKNLFMSLCARGFPDRNEDKNCYEIFYDRLLPTKQKFTPNTTQSKAVQMENILVRFYSEGFRIFKAMTSYFTQPPLSQSKLGRNSYVAWEPLTILNDPNYTYGNTNSCAATIHN